MLQRRFQSNFQEQIVQHTYKLFNQGVELYQIRQSTLPKITFDLKGQIAGRAYYKGDWKIRYNLIYSQKFFPQFLKETVPHEVAHLLEYLIYGKTGHKQHWKMIMRDFGISNASRCHRYHILKENPA